MTTSMPTALRHGMTAGLVGGFVSGLALAQLGRLPMSGNTRAAAAGLAVHLAVCVALGAGFGALLRRRPSEPGQIVFWGLVYGILWWYAGALTLLPLLSGQSFGWGIGAARTALPDLFADLLLGLVSAAVFAVLQQPPAMRDWRHTATAGLGTLVRGLVSGLAATALLSVTVGAPFTSIATGTPALVTLGLLAGAAHAVLYPKASYSAGPAAARGVGLGFALWIVGPVTLTPVLGGRSLPWSAGQIRELFPALPACLLLGAAIAVIAAWLTGLRRLLSVDPAERADEEGLGTRTTRALLRGAAGGVAGGLFFTVIMAQIGYFGTVAQLVGSPRVGVGVTVHLAISVLLGSSYGLFFRRQSDDLASGIGWGVSWGFLWWILGALTILPAWLQGTPQWTAEAAAAAFPSLIGHVGYGAALGAVFYAFEAAHNPWWVRGEIPASVGERLARRRAELAVAAPAVWASTVLITITLTIVLAPGTGG